MNGGYDRVIETVSGGLRRNHDGSEAAEDAATVLRQCLGYGSLTSCASDLRLLFRRLLGADGEGETSA